MGTRAVVNVVRIGNGRAQPDDVRLIFYYRDRTKQDDVDDAEDGGVKADAEREGNYRNDREGRSPQQVADSIADVF